MNQGRPVFAQLIKFLSHNEFNRCVARYWGNKSVRSFSCWDQFLTMAFAQLTYRESLRDIEVCLAAQRHKLYHSAFSGPVKRSTLADANEKRDWRIYRDFAQSLIRIARPLYAHSDLGLELDATAYAFDATTIDLCLSLFPWASFRKRKGAIKLHTLLEIHSAIPVFIAITADDVHEVNLLDELTPEPGSFIVMDRCFVDFRRLYGLHTTLAFFVIRTKGNLRFRRRYSHAHDRATGVRSDQTIVLTGPLTSTHYPIALRRVHYYSVETDQRLVLANIPCLSETNRWPLKCNASVTAFCYRALLKREPPRQSKPLLPLLVSLRDLRSKARFRFTTHFLEVKHGNTAAQPNFFGAKLLEESKAGPPAGWDEYDWTIRHGVRDRTRKTG